MSTMVVRVGSKTTYTIERNPILKVSEAKSEQYGSTIGNIGTGILTTYMWSKLGGNVLAAAGVEQIRSGFQQVIDVFTAIAEPILWGYAVVGLVMVATGKKQAGWDRVKSVGWSYLCIAMLPTFFAFLRWVAIILKQSITF